MPRRNGRLQGRLRDGDRQGDRLTAKRDHQGGEGRRKGGSPARCRRRQFRAVLWGTPSASATGRASAPPIIRTSAPPITPTGSSRQGHTMATVAPPRLTSRLPAKVDVERVVFFQRLCTMASRTAAVHFSTAVHPFLPAPLHPGYDDGFQQVSTLNERRRTFPVRPRSDQSCRPNRTRRW
jgi:hypothetical protein